MSADDGTTYQIVRFNSDAPNRIIAEGITLDEAQAHCQRDDTSGDGWFDGYEAEGIVAQAEAVASEAHWREVIDRVKELGI